MKRFTVGFVAYGQFTVEANDEYEADALAVDMSFTEVIERAVWDELCLSDDPPTEVE